MLRLFFQRCNKKVNLPCMQLSSRYSIKNSGGQDDSEVPNMTLKPLEPYDKIMKCLRRDKELMKRKLLFWKDFKNESIDPKTGKVLDYDHPSAPIFPNYCDVLIIGGGAIGSSIAYWCKTLGKGHLNVVVVEKDPTYTKASTVLSVGGLRQQFSLEENIEMSLFGAEFIRNINDYLGIPGEPDVDVQFHPYGYLCLAPENKVDILRKNSKLQNEKGAKNILLTKQQLKSKFPWLSVEDIELGCLGIEREGWFDPWLLLSAFKKKAITMGADYVTATAKGFNFENMSEVITAGVKSDTYEKIKYCVVQTEDGKMRPIQFAKCIIAAGAYSADIAKMARIGYGRDILSVPLPVEPRKRYVYCFHAPDGPGLNTPLTVDPTGVYFRREGLDNNYICGRCPTEDEEPPVDNLEVDQEFFNENIWPILANRVKAFENLKIKSSWAGYYEYNTYDENGVIGFHPYHDNIIFATGFSGHGIQQAPAIGRAVMELIKDGQYNTINLNRLSFDRFITEQPIMEANIW